MPQKKKVQAADTASDAQTAPEVPGELLHGIDPKVAAKTKQTTKKLSDTESEPSSTPDTADDNSPEPAGSKTTVLDDQATEEAVNQIAVDEGDTMLALEDVANDTENEDKAQQGEHHKTVVFLFILFLIVAAVAYTSQLRPDIYQNNFNTARDYIQEKL